MGAQHSCIQNSPQMVHATKYSESIENSADAIMVIGDSLTIVATNKNVESLFSGSSSVLHQPIMDLIPATQPTGATLKETMNSLLESVYMSSEGSCVCSVVLQKLNKETIRCRIWLQFISWHDRNGIQLVCREVLPGEEISEKYMAPDMEILGVISVVSDDQQWDTISNSTSKTTGLGIGSTVSHSASADAIGLLTTTNSQQMISSSAYMNAQGKKDYNGASLFPLLPTDDPSEIELLNCLNHIKTIIQGIDNSRLIISIEDQVEDCIQNHVRGVVKKHEDFNALRATLLEERTKRKEAVHALEDELATQLQELDAEKKRKEEGTSENVILKRSSVVLKEKVDTFFKEFNEWSEEIVT